MDRLDKMLSLAGLTRSEAKKVISAGKVTVCGKVERNSAAHADAKDVCLNGAPIDAAKEITVMLNKPAGVVTATEDKHFPTVVSLLPEKYARRKLGPVGRLDRDVTGLVLLTTDGELAHRLISPKWKAEKCYRAVCEGMLTQSDVEAFENGLVLSDFTAKPSQLCILEASPESSTADVILREGKFHQVKRMFSAVGHPLISLKRLRIGCVSLDDGLAEGESRLLTEDEIKGLKELVNLQ